MTLMRLGLESEARMPIHVANANGHVKTGKPTGWKNAEVAQWTTAASMPTIILVSDLFF